MFHIKQLYMQYKQDIYRYLLSLTQDHSLSEDLLSETFVKAMISLPTYKGDSSIKTWLFGIARNTWLQHLRSNKHTVEYYDLVKRYVTENMEDRVITKQTIRRIEELLSAKDEQNRQVIKMRIDGAAYALIAEKLHISQSSARVLAYRTKQWLKAVLEEEGFL